MGIKTKKPKQSLVSIAKKKATIIATYYENVGISSVVPVWSNREAKKHGGTINDKIAMGFVIEIKMRVGDNVNVVLPLRRDYLREIDGAYLLELAGLAIKGAIKEEMRELEDHGRGTYEVILDT